MSTHDNAHSIDNRDPRGDLDTSGFWPRSPERAIEPAEDIQLGAVLAQLKIMNLHLSIISDNTFTREDVE